MKPQSLGYLELPTAHLSLPLLVERHARSITVAASVAAVMAMHVTLYLCVLIPTLIPVLAPFSMAAGAIAYSLGFALWLTRHSNVYTKLGFTIDCVVGLMGLVLIAVTIACFS